MQLAAEKPRGSRSLARRARSAKNAALQTSGVAPRRARARAIRRRGPRMDRQNPRSSAAAAVPTTSTRLMTPGRGAGKKNGGVAPGDGIEEDDHDGRDPGADGGNGDRPQRAGAVVMGALGHGSGSFKPFGRGVKWASHPESLGTV